jgi:hypothetical protein
MNEQDMILTQDAGSRVFVPAQRQIERVPEFERSGLSAPKFAAMAGVMYRKRQAGDIYSRDSVSVIGIPDDIYDRGISDFENGPPRAGAHASGPARGIAGCF